METWVMYQHKTKYFKYEVSNKKHEIFLTISRKVSKLAIRRCGGLMNSALVRSSQDRVSGAGSSKGQGRCVVFLGKALYSHSTFPHPGVLMGTGCWG